MLATTMEGEKSGHRLAVQTGWCGMCLGPGGNVSCLSGRCPATGRRPIPPAERAESRGSRVERQSRVVHRPVQGTGNKGQRAEAGIAWDQEKASHRARGTLGTPFSQGPELVRCLSLAHELLEQIQLFLHLQVRTAFLAQMLYSIVCLLCERRK